MHRFVLVILALGLATAACSPSETDTVTTYVYNDAVASMTTTASAPTLVPKDADGIVTRPWVRLHTAKDYYDVAPTVADCPDLRVTFNLTPVLLLQLEETTNGTRDTDWVHTEIPARDLTEEQRQFVVDRFFDGAFRELIGKVYDDLGSERPGYIRVPIVADAATEPDRSPDGVLTISVGPVDAP